MFIISYVYLIHLQLQFHIKIIKINTILYTVNVHYLYRSSQQSVFLENSLKYQFTLQKSDIVYPIINTIVSIIPGVYMSGILPGVPILHGDEIRCCLGLYHHVPYDVTMTRYLQVWGRLIKDHSFKHERNSSTRAFMFYCLLCNQKVT